MGKAVDKGYIEVRSNWQRDHWKPKSGWERDHAK